jgi:hypothetical protein
MNQPNNNPLRKLWAERPPLKEFLFPVLFLLSIGLLLLTLALIDKQEHRHATTTAAIEARLKDRNAQVLHLVRLTQTQQAREIRLSDSLRVSEQRVYQAEIDYLLLANEYEKKIIANAHHSAVDIALLIERRYEQHYARQRPGQ